MPRFFIDTRVDDHRHRDETGRELADFDTARLGALARLPDIAREDMPDGDWRTCSVVVRDEQNNEVYSASLKFGSHRYGRADALEDIVEALVNALERSEADFDEEARLLIREMLVKTGQLLAKRIGPKGVGVKLN